MLVRILTELDMALLHQVVCLPIVRPAHPLAGAGVLLLLLLVKRGDRCSELRFDFGRRERHRSTRTSERIRRGVWVVVMVVKGRFLHCVRPIILLKSRLGKGAGGGGEQVVSSHFLHRLLHFFILASIHFVVQKEERKIRFDFYLTMCLGCSITHVPNSVRSCWIHKMSVD